MSGTHKVGISSFAYSFACGTRPYEKPEHVMTPFDLIDKALEIGAEVVQFGDNMPLEIYSDEELDKIRQYAAERGIELEAGMRRSTEERLAEYIRITNKIGAHVLRLITDGGYDGIVFRPDFEECCRIFKAVIPMLEETGVVLGIENHDRFRVHDYVRMIETVNHPQVGLTVDSVNSLSIEEPLEEVLKNMAPYCVCLHIKDYAIRRVKGGGGLRITGACTGIGRLDVRRCYEECRDRSPYDFNIILESWMEPGETLEETLQMEDDWAKTGVEYMKNL